LPMVGGSSIRATIIDGASIANCGIGIQVLAARFKS
jgi:hypothetical protein